MNKDFISIVYASSLSNQTITDISPIIRKESPIEDLNNKMGEIVLIYLKREVMTDQTLKIWHQFNLDFDRQLVKINHKSCQSRCHFFRKITSILKHQKHLDFLLFLCQQTIFGNILQAVYQLFREYNVLVIDSQTQSEINLTVLSGNDISLQINKDLKVVSHENPEIQIKKLHIQLVVMSIRNDKEIHVHLNLTS